MKSVSRRIFEPKNTQDLLAYKYFVVNGRWKAPTCPFQLVWPYLTIPAMLQTLTATYYLNQFEEHIK